ncbi:hypothetical protein RN001_006656 [Aquatica leii]|uniref:Uncharacterized protein n=1 Tax=Aquatica leii TaxID=1421715 RepID=A0AAN7SIQ5_9COLE|nr:hypothetical protein RN001_006656 [Aquatica leii]
METLEEGTSGDEETNNTQEEETNIVKEIKARRIRWYGHLSRKEEESIAKKIMKWKPQETRAKGKPNIRWEDQVINDIKTMRIDKWSEKMKNRTDGGK